jgi:hypothetical protein
MGTDERKTRRGDWAPLELFIAGVRQMGEVRSLLLDGGKHQSQLTFNLRPLGEDQGLTVGIP